MIICSKEIVALCIMEWLLLTDGNGLTPSETKIDLRNTLNGQEKWRKITNKHTDTAERVCVRRYFHDQNYFVDENFARSYRIESHRSFLNEDRFFRSHLETNIIYHIGTRGSDFTRTLFQPTVWYLIRVSSWPLVYQIANSRNNAAGVKKPL